MIGRRVRAWVGLLSGRHARTLREVLALAANTIAARDDGLDEIRTRIENGAPGCDPGTPTHCKADDWKEHRP